METVAAERELLAIVQQFVREKVRVSSPEKRSDLFTAPWYVAAIGSTHAGSNAPRSAAVIAPPSSRDNAIIAAAVGPS